MKRLVIMLLCLTMVLCFCSCGNSGDNSTTEGTEETTSGEEGTDSTSGSKDVELVEHGYTVDEDAYLHYGFVIKNPDEKVAYEFPKVIITAYDENGDVLATEEQVMQAIQPGEQQSFGSLIDCNGQKPDKVEFSVESGDVINASEEAIKSSDLEVSGTNERPGEYGDTAITGKVKNNSSKDTTTVGVTALFKKDGKIVYGSTTYVDNLGAGKEKAFDFSEYNIPEHDSYEVTAHDWGY